MPVKLNIICWLCQKELAGCYNGPGFGAFWGAAAMRQGRADWGSMAMREF